MSGPVAVIGTFKKPGRETCRVALDTYKGVNLIDVRLCVEIASATDVLSPTKSGVSLRVELLPELRRLIVEAEAKARELGWIGGDA